MQIIIYGDEEIEGTFDLLDKYKKYKNGNKIFKNNAR